MYDILSVTGGNIEMNLKTRVRGTYKYAALRSAFVR